MWKWDDKRQGLGLDSFDSIDCDYEYFCSPFSASEWYGLGLFALTSARLYDHCSKVNCIPPPTLELHWMTGGIKFERRSAPWPGSEVGIESAWSRLVTLAPELATVGHFTPNLEFALGQPRFLRALRADRCADRPQALMRACP